MKKVRLERRIQKILINTMIPMAALLAVFLGIMAQYVASYDRLSENLAVSSNFNLHFKDDLDLEMYYIAVGTMEAKHLSEVMPLVDEAEETIGKLKGNTTNHESRRSLERLEGYMTNLRKRMPQLTEIETFDERIGFMDNNIRILTSLIVEEMQNFIYQESMYLVKMEGAMTRGVYIMVGGLAVLLTIMIAVLLRRSFRLSRDITRPVTEILANVREVGRGNFEIPEVQADSVEIEELDSGIRRMAERIQVLLENVKKEEEMQHLTQLQLLQAQVNPHFLYNTLDTIIWLIEGGMPDDAVEMISSLSVFFRTSLSKGNDIIPLSEEKRHTVSYLEIQQSRYRDILEFEIDIPEEFDGMMVPKLSIQPLAENAIYHGIKNKRGGGKILIEGEKDGEDLILRVTDNGKGMTAEHLEEIRRSIRTGERAGFGLAAVAERLRLYYGAGYGMEIRSQEGWGTVVEIRIGNKINLDNKKSN